jgi:hypothetical protein
MDTERRPFAFTPFDRSTAQFVKAPQITIQLSGTFSFNASAYKGLGDPAYVEMFYDTDQQVIGFQGKDEETLRTYPIRRQGPKANVWLVAGKAFLNYFKIDYAGPKRYLAEIMDDRMVILDLAKGGARVIGNRPRKQVPENAGQNGSGSEEAARSAQ